MEKPVRYAQSMQQNTKTLQYVHDCTSLIFGISAGILQLESTHGFLFLLAAYTSSSLLFAITYCSINPGKYFESPFKSLFIDNAARYLFSFLMSWTLAYALIKS